MVMKYSNFSIENGILGREQSMDLLRILACFGVIFAHSGTMCFAIDVVEKGSIEWGVCCVVKQVLKLSVPIFAMLTGYFFLNPNKELPMKKLYGEKVLRLVIALVFWILFNAATVHSQYYPFGGIDTNFWYVGMCIGLYISMPVLRRVAADYKILSYSCWAWLIIMCYCFIGRFVEVPLVFTDYVFVEFVGYCLWGYYLPKMNLTKKRMHYIYIIGLIAMLATFAVPILTNEKVRFHYSDPAPILAVFAIFLFFVKHPFELSNRWGRVLAHFSKVTFGIYMAHTFVVIEAFSRISRFVHNPIALVLVATCAIFAMSYIIVLVIKQIPILKNWVV